VRRASERPMTPEPGDQRIWFDDDGDGWGLFWTRAG
jgi:hypothetical protein